ncbi:MAG: restriction endonuclease subunit S [Gammaproteobacteria bacterium]|nr:restriction endonuclease subunit S [Gammaproteobacteria bacterium]
MSRPFDEARYRALLEGLEMAVIWKSAINEELRYEAEFYRQRYLHEDMALSHWPTQTIGEFAYVTDGPHGYHIVDELSPIVMLTAKNAKDWFSERDGADPIAGSVDIKNKRSSLEAGDIILSTRGTVGMCALVIEESLPANIDQDVARITWPDKQHLLPEFVVAYLNSTFGQDRITRYASGMVQQGLSLEKVREIPLPLLSPETQAAIAETVRAALRMRRQAVKNIHESEQTLLRALGLENWQPPEPLTYTRSSRDAFAAGRLDAEYFTPKYAELEAHIRATGNFTSLGELLVLNERGTQPEYAESGLLVVNSKHVNKGEVRLNDDNRQAVASHKALKIKNGDVLINGTGVGTIGRAAPYLHNQDAIPDNHVTVLRSKKGSIDPVYLSVFLNSLAGQYQVNKWLRGSSGQTELYPNDIAQFIIWIAPDEIQKSIRKAVDDALDAKRKAAQLLNAAQRAVEIAIETGEAAALAFLNVIDERNSPSP